MSAADSVDFIEANDIQTVLIGGCDINGQFRGKRIPAARFVSEPDAAMHFADVMCAMDWAEEIIPRDPGHVGWFPSWEIGFGDLEGKPDLSTLAVLPWAERTAVVLCDFNDVHGSPIDALPRNVLRNVTDRVARAGLVPIMTPELEFHVFNETAESLDAKDFRDPRPLDTRSSTYGVETATRAEPLISRIRDAAATLGFPIEASNSEAGPGQFELNLSPATALLSADNAFLFKHAVRQISSQMGYTASFLAKLAPGGFGSSLHVHQSMQDSNGTNLFYDGKAEDKLSPLARQYTAGLLATMREFTAVFAPTINSYKRFEPHAAAGCTVTWAVQSKSVSIRAVTESAAGCRIEHRTPGADANPYLVLAAMLAGGLWGIENDLELEPAHQGDGYSDGDVEWVPKTLHDAISLFEDSVVANKYFGEDAVRYFAATRRWEIEQFNATVTNWELRRYLELA